ncbi:hypothetical protein BDW74DRAFT_180368 [Aspergillus multicolor]|uniref:EXPERA domain-containing protein n=1 Tax=Aspergillus multicolor TaxID=41759 RepID=UPI003CCD178A
MSTLHSYYPPGVEIPDYVPNELSTPSLLAIFATACTVVFSATAFLAKSVNPRISDSELAKTLWFALCGSIHSILEGYYALNFLTVASSLHPLAQLWKEYSLSDSRYLIPNSFVMPMESITALFWGPLSFVLVWFIITQHPLRHPLQIIISLGQLYGDVLYYGTCAFEYVVNGNEFSRPEAYYFWGYFMLLNAFWIGIPGGLILDSVKAIRGAFVEVKGRRTAGVGGSSKKTL